MQIKYLLISLIVIFMSIVILGNRSVVNGTISATSTPTNTVSINPVVAKFDVNEDCLLPCLWNITFDDTLTPTLLQENLNNVFNQEIYGPNREEYYGLDINIIQDEEDIFPEYEFGASFDFENNRFILGTLYIFRIQDWATSDNIFHIKNILLNVDEQPDIYFGMHLIAPQYHLIFVYKDLSFAIEYTFEFEDDQFFIDDNILICPEFQQIIYIKTWIQNIDISESIEEKASALTADDHNYFISLSEMTNTDNEQLVDEIVNNDEACFSGLSFVEYQKNGYEPLPG